MSDTELVTPQKEAVNFIGNALDDDSSEGEDQPQYIP
jgi:hypothetical protein